MLKYCFIFGCVAEVMKLASVNTSFKWCCSVVAMWNAWLACRSWVVVQMRDGFSSPWAFSHKMPSPCLLCTFLEFSIVNILLWSFVSPLYHVFCLTHEVVGFIKCVSFFTIPVNPTKWSSIVHEIVELIIHSVHILILMFEQAVSVLHRHLSGLSCGMIKLLQCWI